MARGVALVAALLALAGCGSSTVAGPVTTPTPSPAAFQPSPPPGQCRAGDVKVQYLATDGATGHVAARFVFLNRSNHDCNLRGFPSVTMLDGSGAPIGPAATNCDAAPAGHCWASGVESPATQIVLTTGATPVANPGLTSDVPGSFLVDWLTQCPAGAAPASPASFRILPPGISTPLTVTVGGPFQVQPCASTLEVYPVQP